MIVPDTNLLLYAYDSESPFHKKAKEWWVSCVTGSETVGLAHPVIFAFLRIGTNGRAFTNPLPLADATEIIAEWLAIPVVEICLPDDDHVQRVLRLLSDAASSGGNLVTDAQVASLACAHKAVVHTADRDFLRFKQLDTFYPLDTQ